MSQTDTTHPWNESYQYRVRLIYELTPTDADPGGSPPVAELTTPWQRNLEYIARLAEDLSAIADVSTEVERRARDSTVDYEAL